MAIRLDTGQAQYEGAVAKLQQMQSTIQSEGQRIQMDCNTQLTGFQQQMQQIQSQIQTTITQEVDKHMQGAMEKYITTVMPQLHKQLAQ